MATARLMETWAHGLDVADALGVERGRGTVALDSASGRAQPATSPSPSRTAGTRRAVPRRAARPGRLGLGVGSGGRGAADHRFGGGLLLSGRHQRRPLSALDIEAVGDDAKRWLAIAQAFAGPPGPAASARPRLAGTGVRARQTRIGGQQRNAIRSAVST